MDTFFVPYSPVLPPEKIYGYRIIIRDCLEYFTVQPPEIGCGGIRLTSFYAEMEESSESIFDGILPCSYRASSTRPVVFMNCLTWIIEEPLESAFHLEGWMTRDKAMAQQIIQTKIKQRDWISRLCQRIKGRFKKKD